MLINIGVRSGVTMFEFSVREEAPGILMEQELSALLHLQVMSGAI
jgi:hypothetical protein